MHTLKGIVSGRVQGVGFRYFVQGEARAAQVKGYAKNLADGNVEFVLQGEESKVRAVELKIHQGPELSRVDSVQLVEGPSDSEFLQFEVL